MNKYFKYTESDPDLICYMELDAELYCLKSITEINGSFINTNLIVEGEYFLPEGCFIDSLEYLIEISKEEFHEIWLKSIAKYLESWNKFKESKRGGKINAEIVCFYPQGIILNIGEDFYGIADYEKCKNYFGAKMMYPTKRLDLYISEYDNSNLWVKLEI